MKYHVKASFRGSSVEFYLVADDIATALKKAHVKAAAIFGTEGMSDQPTVHVKQA